MTDNEKTTALIPSVGADGGQPPHNSTNQSILHETCESNPPEGNIEEMREKIRRMNDPHYLHTVSMTELYQTAYKPISYYAVPFPVSWTVKMKKKQKETQDILSYHTQAAGCSDKARAKASGGRQPIEECGRTGL